MAHTQDEAEDPLAVWLAGVIHPVTLEELNFDIEERTQMLGQLARKEARIAGSDLVVCSHPVVLCILLATISDRHVFTHASSTLLYGLPCHGCAQAGSTLRLYHGTDIQGYFATARSLLVADGTPRRLELLAEGSFLARQMEQQLGEGLTIQWVPPLALYTKQVWLGTKRHNALILRSRFFLTLMGELMRSLLREVASINNVLTDLTLLGADNQFDEQWLSMEQIASYGAAVLYPNDIHQRTFHEVYKMGVPLMVPDELGLYRLQRVSNWGYTSYGGSLSRKTKAKQRASAIDQDPTNSMDAWWNSFQAAPEAAPLYFQQLADWHRMPHVMRFSSVPDFFAQLQAADLTATSQSMRGFHQKLTAQALGIAAGRLKRLLHSH
eukprot:TRINITY_DN22304_c0_g2_i3.p1 TRINITY_DN22304_c0_g2~~TRINITY_DN22304_c0_g2_i3.p1  ORF type:complete len:381 (+),score=37.13 TRINITY_DN22304_c0_g2_i3:939-2081(+)